MKVLYTILCIATGLSAYSQADTTKTSIKLNQVEVIKSFEANLEDAVKYNVQAVLPVQKDFKPKYEYDITIVPIDLKYPDPQIKPLAMNPEGAFIKSKGYVKAGYGLLKNPDIMAGYYTSKKDTYEAGIHLDINALDNTSKNAYQKYQNIGADLYGSYMIKENMKLYGNVTSLLKKRYFYNTHLQVADHYTEEQSKRNINIFAIKAGICNAEPTSHNINYDVAFEMKNLNISNEKVRENGTSVTGHAEQMYGENTVIKVDGKFEYTALNADTSTSITTAQFSPGFKTNVGDLIIHAGINYIYGSRKQSSLFPEILLSYGIAGHNLQVFAGSGQNYYTNNLSNVTKLNPYLNTTNVQLYNSVSRELFGGIKGRFSFLSYQIKGGYKKVDRQMFLLNNREDLRKFDMVFDDLKMVFISGNVDFNITQNITLGGWLTQNIYTLKVLPNAWHLPTVEANVYAKTKWLDSKLSITSELFFNNRVNFINKTNDVQKSNILFDLNINAEYSLTEKFGVFVKGINLLNNKFERWYGYPTVGINGMVGVHFVF